MPKERPRKYNNPNDLDELCRSFLKSNEKDPGAAIEYCKSFLLLLNEETPPTSGAVRSSRARSR